MRKGSLLPRQMGFGLIEWMIGLTIGLFLVAGVAAIFVQTRTGSTATNQAGELQETGRIALQLITQDVRQVGFWGMSTSNVMTRLNATKNNEIIVPNVTTLNDCSDDLGGGSFPIDNIHFKQFWSFEIPSGSSLSYMRCIIDDDPDSELQEGSDVISLKRLQGKRIEAPASGSVVSSSPFLFVGGHSKAAIFTSGLAPPTDPALAGLDIWHYLHNVYFLDHSLSRGIPRLRRMSLSDTGMAIEPVILEGVENIQLYYIVEAANGSTSYQTSVTATDKVIGVEVFILIRALEETRDYQNTNTYVMADKSITVNDNYRRLLVSSVVSFSNAIWLDKSI